MWILTARIVDCKVVDLILGQVLKEHWKARFQLDGTIRGMLQNPAEWISSPTKSYIINEYSFEQEKCLISQKELLFTMYNCL